MNERAREALVAAALRGTPQIKGALSDGKDGRCALGVLVEALFGEARRATAVELDLYTKTYELSFDESSYIQYANDVAGWDFLTIARKIGVKEGA